MMQEIREQKEVIDGHWVLHSIQAIKEHELKVELETIWSDSLNDEVTKNHWLKFWEEELDDLKLKLEQNKASYENEVKFLKETHDNEIWVLWLIKTW